MCPYTRLTIKKCLLLLVVSLVKGLCYNNQQWCCDVTDNFCISRGLCSWSVIGSYYSLSYLGRMGHTVDSASLCPRSRQYCLKFEYQAISGANLTVVLRQQRLSEVRLWTQQWMYDNAWLEASVPISNISQEFSISITASLFQTQRYRKVNLRNIYLGTESACPTIPAQAMSTTVAPTTRRITVQTTRRNGRASSLATNITTTKTTVKVTSASTDSLSVTTPQLLATTNNSRHHAPAVSDAEMSDVTSPLTAVAVSVTVVMVVMVVVTVIVFIKRRQVCVYIKRLGTRENESGRCRNPDFNVDLSDIRYSAPPSTVREKPYRPFERSGDNDISVYQNFPNNSRVPESRNKNNDCVNGPIDEPHLYSTYVLKESEESKEDSVGIYHVIQHAPETDTTVDNPAVYNDAIYSLAQTPGMTSDEKADNSPYNALNLPGEGAALPRDTGSHDLYNHLSEEEGAYNHANTTRTNEFIDDEYSHIHLDDLSSESDPKLIG